MDDIDVHLWLQGSNGIQSSIYFMITKRPIDPIQNPLHIWITSKGILVCANG